MTSTTTGRRRRRNVRCFVLLFAASSVDEVVAVRPGKHFELLVNHGSEFDTRLGEQRVVREVIGIVC